MRQLNNQEYKDALKSVHKDFDETGLWQNIESQVEKKQRKNCWVWIVRSILSISTLLFLWFVVFTNEEQKAHFSESNTIVEVASDAAISMTDNSNSGSQPSKLENVSTSKEIISSRVKQATSELATIENESGALSEVSISTGNAKHQNIVENVVIVGENKIIGPAQYKEKKFGTNYQDTLQSLPQIEHLQLFLEATPRLLSRKRAVFQAIKEKRQSMTPSFFSVTSQLSMPATQYEVRRASDASWVSDAANHTVDLYSLGVSVNYGLALTDNFTMLAGLHVGRRTNRVNISFQDITTKTVETDSAIYLINSFGESQFYKGEQIETTTLTSTIQNYNHLYTLGISLGGQYEMQLTDKVSCYGNGVLHYNPIQFAKGIAINEEAKVDEFSQFTSGQSLAISCGLGMNYRLNGTTDLTAGFRYLSDITSRYNSEFIKVTSQSLGMELGLRFRLR